MATTLELQIGQRHPGEYEVRVVRAAAGGEPRAPLSLDVDRLLAQRSELENKVLASAAAARRVVPVGEQAVQQMGQQLFDALFAGPVSGTYRASQSVALARQEKLQIVLRLESPELTLLPWETLFDPLVDAYVCRHEPMVRHLPASYTPNPLPVEPPLRILVVIASPRGLPLLDTEAERERLGEALAEQVAAGRVELVWLTDATWSSLHARLLDGPWHVLHFIGHGDYDVRSEEGLIALVGDGGSAHMVEASRLADLVGEADPAPRLMVLNSCASAQGGSDDGFSSVGAALVRGGISAVAAMQFAVSDRASVRFAQGFYTALAHGRRVDNAVRSGRISMLGAGQSLEWITPVLYVRGEANLLFNLPTSERPAPQDGPHRSVDDDDRTGARARELYVLAKVELRIGRPGKAVELLDQVLALNPNHSEAIRLRAEAAGQDQLLGLHDRAVEAEKAGRWSYAADCYEQIAQKDPQYQDALARRDFCREQERIAHLQDELRHHAEAERWETVIEVGEELADLDPAAADPDGLTARARTELRKHAAHLERVYIRAREAEEAEDWPMAIACYDELTKEAGEYGDCVRRRSMCLERQRRAAETFQIQDPSAVHPKKILEIKAPCGALAWASGGWSVAVKSWADARIRVYDMAGYERFTVRTANKWGPYVLAASPDGTRLVGQGKKGAAVWDAKSGEQAVRFPSGPRVTAAAFSWDGSRIATGAVDSVCVWDAGSAQKIFSFRQRAVNAVTFSPDGGRLVIADQDGLHVWDVGTSLKIFEDRRGFLGAVAYSPDGRRVATGGLDGTARLWNPGQVEELAHEGSVTSVAFSPDGARLVTGSEDRTARVWDTAHARMICEMPHDSPVTSVAFSPYGTRLATGTRSGVTLWTLG
ncbi:CHAT domain-containing protein [Streptomyces sp. NPDC093094]|uniref:CHAT domain-containing protein n=1 Tax=Streptomyces sp. NPDC093094 TaxID=3366026 RepID=UPI003804A4B0